MIVTAETSFAQSPGRILGRITRVDNGEPVASATVQIEGMNRGAASDLAGEYYILALDPGRYTVNFRALGYRAQRIEQVVINSGSITTLNVQLTEQAIEMEPVTVIFTRPPVNVTESSQRISVEGSVARQMPIRQSDEIVQIQPGVSRDRNGLLHLRGGRSGEIGYIIDGIRVEDPLEGDLASTIGRESLHELQLLTGTFSAEYGQAMSGLVSIVTREGGPRYSASVDVESPMVNASTYRKADWAGEHSDYIRVNSSLSAYSPSHFFDSCDPPVAEQGRLSATLSGPIPFTGKRATFFLSGMHDLEDSYLPFGGTWDRQTSGKIAAGLGPGKLTFSFGLNATDEQKYNHQWKYTPSHYHKHSEDHNRFSLDWKHTIGETFFYDVVLGFNRRINKVKVFENWETYVDYNLYPREALGIRLPFFSDRTMWSEVWKTSDTNTRSASVKATWQVNQQVQSRFGAEIRSGQLHLTDLNYYYYTIVSPLGSEYRKVKYFPNNFVENPLELAVWTQQTLTLEGLVIDAGLRLDQIEPNVGGWSDTESSKLVFEQAPVSRQISPRLGIAQPVGDKMSLFFSYGHFFQFPDYSKLFINTSEAAPDSFSSLNYGLPIGNPKLEPERTVAYELGVKGIIGNDWGFTGTGFYKDIFNLLAATTSGAYSQTVGYFNVATARVFGVELTVNKVLSDYWSLQANYTWSVARGDASDALDDAISQRVNPDDPNLEEYKIPEAWNDYYLDFDRRHVANLMLTWQSSWTQYPHRFGPLLRGFSAGMIISYASGLPYTAWYARNEIPPEPNALRMDGSLRIDLRAGKTLVSSGQLSLSLFVSVENLLERVNPLEVDRTTGQPWETTWSGSSSTAAMEYDRAHDPSRVDVPRLVRVGLTLEL
ncbi:MAG: TonB-dependent receptor [bacterium]